MSVFGNSFSGPLVIPSTMLGTAGSGANIDGGLTTGDVFDGRGGDFLDPSDIQGTLDHFGGSIGGSSMIFGDNPNFLDIHNITKSQINKIFSDNFFPRFNNVDILNAPYIQPVPALQGNVNAGDVLAASTFFQLGVELAPNLYQTQQNNPYLWNGPSANDIFTGSLISQNNILGGNFSWPNNFPNSLIGTGGTTSSSLSFTGLPYFGEIFGNPYTSLGNSFGQNSLSSLFGGGFGGNSFGGFDPFNSMAGGLLGQGYNGGGLFGDYPGLYGSPLAGGMPLSSFGDQVSMLDYIFSQGQGLLGSMGQGLFSGGYGGLF